MIFEILAFTAALYCLCATSVNSSDITVRVPPTEGNWHPIKPPSLQSWTGNMVWCSPGFTSWQAVIRIMAAASWAGFSPCLFTPSLMDPSSDISHPMMSPPFLLQQAFFLAFVPCKCGPAKSLCAELPSVLCGCSISISHPCGSALLPLCSSDVGAAGRAAPRMRWGWGPWTRQGGGWCSAVSLSYRSVPATWSQGGWVLGLAAVGSPISFASLSAETNCWVRVVVFFSLISYCLWWMLHRGVVSSEWEHRHTCWVSMWGCVSQRSKIGAAVYKRPDIKSINGTLCSRKFSHPVIFPFRQERCENHVDAEAELHSKTGVFWSQPQTMAPSGTSC